MTTDPPPVPLILLVGGDLNAHARIDDAARRAGAELRRSTPDSLASEIAARAPSLVVVDLDDVGADVLDAITGDVGLAVVAYFSHVDVALGERAKEAGFDALPRGRFW
ncbi:MAG: hypothetical protein ACR2LG_04210, partial [Actinomycetota bacterium]